MNKMKILFTSAFVVIVACMIYLVWNGIALRTQPIIKPSVIKNNGQNIYKGVVLRLAPVLKEARYVIFGFAPLDEKTSQLFLGMVSEAEELLKQKIQVIDGVHARASEIEKCEKPCWILVPPGMASEMTGSDWLRQNISERTEEWISVTHFYFGRPPLALTERCGEQKRLSFDCLLEVSVNEVSRKLKSDNEKYFFMRNYLDRNYLLFVEPY